MLSWTRKILNRTSSDRNILIWTEFHSVLQHIQGCRYSGGRGISRPPIFEIFFFLLINFWNLSKLWESFRKNRRYPPPIFNNFVFLPVSFRKFSKNRKKFSTPPHNTFDLARPLKRWWRGRNVLETMSNVHWS
jgi:hypothetical protein